MALETGMRPGELSKSEVYQIQRRKLDDEEVFVIRANMGLTDCVSKCVKGGWRDACRKPKEVVIWNRTDTDGCLNIYDDIDQYLPVRSSFVMNAHNKSQFFSGINHRASWI